MKFSVKFFSKYLVNATIALVVLAVASVGFLVGDTTASSKVSAVYKGNSKDKVSLMVNVYWGTEYVERMLEIFEDSSVTTTFFVGGSWVRDNENVFRRIVDAGHEIANHGFFHKDHEKISVKDNREEILATHELVKAFCGVEMNLFAPPSGAYNQKTLDIASDLGYTTIMWSKDTIDWRDKDAEIVYRRATKNVVGGDLILMHPTEHTVLALEKIINKIKDEGLFISTVSEVIGRNSLEE